MTKAVALIAALASVLAFPAPVAALSAFCASFIFPPAGLLSGALADALYRVPGTFPAATLLGSIATVLGYLVQHVVRTRIMSA